MKAQIINPMNPTIIPLIKEVYQRGSSLADAKAKVEKAYDTIDNHIDDYHRKIVISGSTMQFESEIKKLRKKCAGVLKRNTGLGIEFLKYITVFEYGN